MEKELKNICYTSASGSFPVKVVLNERLMKSIVEDGKILPIHVQLNPTNKCNLSCDWCSCSERDRDKILSAGKILEAMRTYKILGCESVTITGGGEPLLHPEIGEIVRGINDLGISVSLVTNGWCVERLTQQDWELVTWVRVSLGDGREKEMSSSKYWDNMKVLARSCADLSFSYVLTNSPNISLIKHIVQFSNEHAVTHVRMTTDILERSGIYTIEEVKRVLEKDGVDDHLVIYQDRSSWARGQKNCYISLLKPVVGADGKLYPCCGAQYFDKEPAKNYTGCMGRLGDIKDIFWGQSMYDGSGCEVCYYSSYNRLLEKLLMDVEHLEFV